MHHHFSRDISKTEAVKLPSRLYALLDHTEPTNTEPAASQEGAGPALFSFDAIDANQLDQLPSFGSDDVRVCESAWRDYWTELSNPRRDTRNPFDRLPLYRLDTMLSPSDPMRAIAVRTEKPEDRGKWKAFHSIWLEIELLPPSPGSRPAEIYPQMFGAPIPVHIQIKLPSGRRGAALNASFSLNSLPHVSWTVVESLVKRSAAALAVYDVGQGSASALTDKSFFPQLYFDLGCGVYRNEKTSPDSLSFCFTDKPPVLLSHWDTDHWAGAYCQSKSTHSALKMDWVMPHQQVSATHLAFANDILTAGGTVQIFDPPAGAVHSTTLTDGCELTLVRCDGSSRNDSGFAVCVSESATSDLRWLLTGDAVYDHILPHLSHSNTLKFQAVIVPHHGAELSHQSLIPTPLGNTPQYQRLVFSFGPNNAHGRNSTSHPKASTVDAHQNAGWDVGRWNGITAPGHRVAKADVRATGKNGPGCERLHSILINWKGDLVAPQTTSCGGRHCSHQLKQC